MVRRADRLADPRRARAGNAVQDERRELLARLGAARALTGERGRSGRGIPADARSKPGSGGQLIAFVPSLDLVVTRQTGSSGEWPYVEFLRRACAAVIDGS